MSLSWLWLLVGFTVVVVSALSEELQQQQYRRVWRKLLHRERRAESGCQRKIYLDTPSTITEGYNRTNERYSDNMNCTWRISVGEQQRILLASLDFQLEYSPNCRFDSVEIFDGSFRPEGSIGKFCGRHDVRLISRSHVLYINFQSDEGVTATGFRFEIRKLEKASSAKCNRTVTEAPGIIRSINYPQRYPYLTTCLYKIEAPSNMTVKLEFDDFSLEKEPCDYDFLTIYDGQSSASKVLGSYCGRHVPRYIVSSTNVLLLYFHSDDYVNEKGFSLNYTFVKEQGGKVVPGDIPLEYDPECSADITEVGHNLTSPNLNEDFYLALKKCRTSIRAPANQRVILNIETFDLEESSDCIYDHVNITYQTKEGGVTTVRICGFQRWNSLCFESWNNQLTLDYTSDRMFEGRGYRATYRFVPDNSTDVTCNTSSCDDGCNGYCYRNGRGDFHCACPTGKVPNECTLNVTWNEPLQNLTMYERSQVTLDCTVNHPYAITAWDFNDTLLPDDTMPHVKVGESTISLNGTRVNDTGRYTCTVQVGEWMRSRTMWLTVKEEKMVEKNKEKNGRLANTDNNLCGFSSSKIIDPNVNAAGRKVAGGNSTDAPDFIPWQVILRNVTMESVHCGGVLITERHVLTAAHCVEGNLGTIKAMMGTLSCNGRNGESREIVRYITHPGYDPTTMKYDFAILELERPVRTRSESIYPICLPTPKVWSSITAGQKGIVSGCGKTGTYSNLPKLLRMVDIPLVTRHKCAEEQRKSGTTFSDDMYCAGYNDDDIGDACKGDSGGPMAVKVDNHWTLIGLVSFGQDCARKGSYGFYANVSYALPWIQTFAGSCGKTRFIEENYNAARIIDGQHALPKQFPWSVAMVDTSNNLKCSTTIISDSWLLTARHCFESLTVSKRKIRFLPGRLKLKTGHERVDPTFKSETSHEEVDLTLVKVKRMQFNDAVQAACLPAEDDAIEPGMRGVVAGWGKTSDASDATTSNHLLYITVSLMNDTQCQSEWRIEDHEMCFKARNTTSETAAGDSGSGLIVKLRDTNTLMAVYKGGNPGQLKSGVYTSIKPFVPWIKKKMGWEPVRKSPCPLQCNNGGTCVKERANDSSGNTWRCDCSRGFSGEECEYEDVVTCEDYACHNGGTCYIQGRGPKCHCLPRFTGSLCTTPLVLVTWAKPLQNLTVYERSQVTLDCTVNHPYAITAWDFNDTLLPDDTMPHVKVGEPIITLHRTRVNDTGRYTCTVQVGEWMRSRTMWLTVKEEKLVEKNKEKNGRLSNTDNNLCGFSSSKIIDPNVNAAGRKVAGGNSTNAPDFIPWQVILRNVTRESVHCGGVLITERHVLTAAHCVEGNLGTINAMMGTLSCNGRNGESREIVRYITHPRYNPNTLKYNFAILELERPVRNRSESIYPICLPTPKVWSSITAGQKGIVSGCGKTGRYSNLPKSLRMVDIPLVPRHKCAEEQKKIRRSFSDDMYCAGYNADDIGDACEGDSGGPMAVKVDNLWTLIGLVSFGQDCARKGSYGFYANVSYALPWIQTFAGSCGKTRFIEEYIAARIIHGQHALPKQFPWSVAMVDKSNNLMCSTTIISDSWLLTARHCFEGLSKRKIRLLRFLPGRLKLKIGHERVEPTFKSKTSHKEADLTLVKVKPMQFNDAVQAACLPAEDDAIEPGMRGVVAGWGKTSLADDATTSNHLLYITVSLMNDAQCQSEWGIEDHKNLTCFKARNTTSETAAGDNGSGLIVKLRDTNTLMAVYNGGHPGQHKSGVYTSIKPFVPWIKKTMGWKPVRSMLKSPCPLQCNNGGTCVKERANDSSGNTWRCDCSRGFSGEECEYEDVVTCEDYACHNGGTCYIQDRGPKCHCLPRFTGSLCTKPLVLESDRVTFTKVPHNITIARGSSVLLECAVEEPNVGIMWLHRDRILVEGDPTEEIEVHPGGVLHVPQVSDDQDGEYTCVALSGGNLFEMSSWVTLTEPCRLHVEKAPQNMTVEEGGSALLQCFVPDAEHTMWRKNGEIIKFDRRKKILVNNYLVLDHIVETDAGEYTCAARASNGCSARVSAFLTIHGVGHKKACGRPKVVKAPGRGERIASGKEVLEGESPWHVIIIDKRHNAAFCGGSLINTQWFLTAAHCVERFEKSFRTPFSREDVNIYVGTVRCDGKQGIQRRLKQYILHPEFKGHNFDNDVALFQLDQPVEFSDLVMPICLERELLVNELLRGGRVGMITGCGSLYEHGMSPTFLRGVTIPYVNRPVCARSAKSVNASFTAGMICAGYSRRMRGDACKGDSGGPYVMEYGGRWIQVGIVSWGVGCDQENHYGYYTHVSKYYDWILENSIENEVEDYETDN